MEYGLIGEHLPHSFSKQIHEQLTGEAYALCGLRPQELEGFLQTAEFRAVNVTIPYKQAVMPYLAEVDGAAERIGADPAACMGVEDSFNGVRAVKAAGMFAVMAPDMIAPTTEILSIADACVDDLREIIEILNNMKGSQDHD